MGDAWDRFTNGLEEAFASVGNALGEWVPKIIVALLVLVIGRWILNIIKTWLQKLLETPAAQTVFDKAGVTSALEPSGRKAAPLLATVGYAFLLLLLWVIVFRILDIGPIVDLLQRLIAVLPLIFVAVAVVLIAAAVANFVAELVQPYAAQRNVGWLPTLVRIVILLAGVLTALDLLEIRFAEDIVKIVVAAAGVAFAVAFGVGGIDTAKRWWARYLAPRDSQG